MRGSDGAFVIGVLQAGERELGLRSGANDARGRSSDGCWDAEGIGEPRRETARVSAGDLRGRAQLWNASV